MIVFVAMSALGAMSRFMCERVSVRLWGERWPWGTLTANIFGSFLLGLCITQPANTTQLIAAQAFCGAFTTFGGFIGQSWTRMRHNDSRWLGLSYLTLTVVASVVAAVVGIGISPALA